MPLNWAAAQHNLAGALAALGGRESGTTRLEEAVAAYRTALKEWTRDCVPLNWAHCQFGLANTLNIIAKRQTSIERIEEALARMRDAVEVYEQGRVSQWLPIAQSLVTEFEADLVQLQI